MDTLTSPLPEMVTIDDFVRAGFCRSGALEFAEGQFPGLTAVMLDDLTAAVDLDDTGSIAKFLRRSGYGYGYGYGDGSGDGYGYGYGDGSGYGDGFGYGVG